MKLATHPAEDRARHTLNPEKTNRFFIDHLNRIYCAKSHLQDRLPEMRTSAYFTDLVHAITETLVDVEQQISRMNEIYLLLGIKPGFESCAGILGLIEDAFSAIHQGGDDPQTRDLSILFYLQNIESIEMASFKMLKLAAPQLERKKIKQLLKENFDEASDDLALLRLITFRYFRSDARH